MTTFAFDHIHLNSPDPMATARYYRDMFGARLLESVQLDGSARVDVDLHGTMIFIAPLRASEFASTGDDVLGIVHIGLRVDDLDVAIRELESKGAKVVVAPRTSTRRPGLRIAFIEGPENVRIELLQRDH